MNNRTQYRVEEVLVRAKTLRRRRENHQIKGLSASCLLLTMGLVGTFSVMAEHLPRYSVKIGEFGAVLLHEGTGGYVLTGVLAFTAGAAIAILCIRWHKKH